MKRKPLITIVLATFNSSKTLPLVLESLQNQSVPISEREILILDGGSTDDTRLIAKKFKCKVINNPKTEPVYAKFLGYIHAKGKYLVYLDHDEVVENPLSLELKREILLKNNDVRAVVGTGYVSPKNYPFINNYINEFGDPFSFFMYRLSKDAKQFMRIMKNRYTVHTETKDYVIFDLQQAKNLPLIELCAVESMVDREYMVQMFPQTLNDPKWIPHFFYLLMERTPLLALTKHDTLLHYSSDTVGRYIKKITWRVKNNIYHKTDMGMSGFTGRQLYNSKLFQYKKFLFLPYSFTLIFPMIDAIYLTITRKNISYLNHVWLCFYTALLILLHTTRKSLGYHPQLKSYDGSKNIINR